jgi:hypothetical protein
MWLALLLFRRPAFYQQREREARTMESMMSTENHTSEQDKEKMEADQGGWEPATVPEPEMQDTDPRQKEIPVHPLAASFPMLEDEDLDALVQDIEVNGLRHPIVLNKAGELIDGRNRLKACARAGVQPTFMTTDVDPVAYILSANVLRRHLSKGQQAMAYAIAYPEATERGGRGKTAVSNTAFSSEYITKARFVLHHAPDLAAKVMAGSSLPDAYAHASEQKREQEEYERLRNEVRDWLDSIVTICARLKAGTEKTSITFLDQTDFVRQVKADAKDIIAHATRLVEDI